MTDTETTQAPTLAMLEKNSPGISERDFPDASRKELRVKFSKLDPYKQVVYGEIYVPYVPDSQGDYMTPEEIERVAHAFLKKGALAAIDTEHNLKRNGSAFVESFIAREGDPDFIKGSWVAGVHIPDPVHWDKVLKGEIGGFSMYGSGRRVQKTVEIEVPDSGVVFGKTATSADDPHTHVYALQFNAAGDFLGGTTNEVNGHTHTIVKGTVTEAVDNHRHRFTFIDSLLKADGETFTDAEQAWQQSFLETVTPVSKRDWDESAVNRWPAGAPESRGGEFAPKARDAWAYEQDPKDPSHIPRHGLVEFKTPQQIRDAAAKGNPNLAHYNDWNLSKRHMWFTRSIAAKLPRIGETSDKDAADVKVAVKLFNPGGAGTWYITEANLDTGEAFGYADLGMGSGELGYIDLNELRNFRGRLRLPIERDEGFSATLKDVMGRSKS